MSCFENAGIWFISQGSGRKDNMATYWTVSDISSRRIWTWKTLQSTKVYQSKKKNEVRGRVFVEQL